MASLMGDSRTKQYGCALLCVVIALAGGGCGGQASELDHERPIEWAVWAVTGKREVRIVGQDGYCVGRPKPKITDLVTRYQGKRVYITAILRDPPGSSGGEGVDCLGVGLAIYKTVTLNRNVDNSVLYDASVDPPEQRWPD
jgi:hypothetical protein